MSPAAPGLGDAIEVAHRTAGLARGGGGNVSVKVDGVLWIKPSGVSLASLTTEDLVGLDVEVLRAALTNPAASGDPEQDAARRARVDAGTRRPSVELLMHAVLPEPMIIHLHPVDLNAVTCAVNGESLTAELFGDQAAWVGYVQPGLPLAIAMAQAHATHLARHGVSPALIMMGNHGISVAGTSADQVTERLAWAQAQLASKLDSLPASTPMAPSEAPQPPTPNEPIEPILRGALASDAGLPVVVSDTSVAIRTLLTQGSAMLTDGPLIPDQIVYAGSLPAVATDTNAAAVQTAITDYRDRHQRLPAVVVVPGLGVFGAGSSRGTAHVALHSFIDALITTRDAERLGGVRVLDADQRGFIETWEAEAYRSQVGSDATPGRMTGRIAVVTGAAQGFGLGIAEQLCREGATVVLADLQAELARDQAARLNSELGSERALGVAVDVTDPNSLAQCRDQIIGTLGGVDLVVANAGIARAGGVFEQSVADFDLVTQVNYRGYFLTVQAFAPVLAAQHRAAPERWFDIVEINSKSGLSGSARNFAYAGSKFGGIGLTQSFALELVTSGIKVNAICPGNYLDGPLWSDPERGLFVQYLNAGKVPGATTVDEVRAYYEAKVPMARGCTPTDVARAVIYAVEQTYETGQAIPVTGGQEMVN